MGGSSSCETKRKWGEASSAISAGRLKAAAADDSTRSTAAATGSAASGRASRASNGMPPCAKTSRARYT